MGACTYVGRVGGLALALGVGAAVLGGTAVGWADDTAGAGATADHSSVQTHTPSRAPRGGAAASDTTGGRGNHAATSVAPAEQRTNGSASPSLPDAVPDRLIQQVAPAAEPVAEVPAAEPATMPAVQPAPAAGSAPVVASDPVAGSAPVVETAAAVVQPAPEPVAAPAAAVAAVPTGTVTALDDPLAGSNRGGVPVDTPLDWTVLAYSRRNPVSAAATAPIPGPAATTGQTLPIIMGPSGVPIPSAKFGETVMNYYITYDTLGTQQLLFTPEGLYPITGVKSLPLNTSVDQGIQILSDSLNRLPAGTPVTVFGYSQSAVMSSLLQGGYTIKVDGQDVKFSVPAGLQDSINFVLVGNEMNPNGGFFSRFSGRDMPLFSLTSLGIDFYGATPGAPVPATGVEYPTTNYTREYDGFADFPRYPINLLADLNAGLGIVFVHTQYAPTITQAQCAEKAFCLLQTQVEAAQPLPSTKPATQKYYFIPTENLPLLQPLRAIPFIGNPLADLLQPSLKALVDFGYADPAHGYKTGTQPDANVLQPFDFLPPANLYGEAFKKFFDGIGQGIKDFIADFGPNGSVAKELSAFSLSNLGPLAMGTTGNFISNVQQTITKVSDWISGTVANIYAALLPTADIANSFLTSLPAYATNLFLFGMQEVLSGNVIQGLSDAFGLPIAATVGLSSTAALVGALVWGQAFAPNLAG